MKIFQNILFLLIITNFSIAVILINLSTSHNLLGLLFFLFSAFCLFLRLYLIHQYNTIYVIKQFFHHL